MVSANNNSSNEFRSENTFRYNGKPEGWKLAQAQIKSIASRRGIADALDKGKISTMIDKTTYDQIKAIADPTALSGDQTAAAKLYEDNLELTEEFLLGLTGNSYTNGILQKLEDTKTPEHPNGVLLRVLEELSGDMLQNEEVAQDILISKLEKIEYEDSKQYKKESEKIVAEANVNVSDREKIRIMRKAVVDSGLEAGEKRQIIKDIMEEQDKAIPSFKAVCRTIENVDDLASSHDSSKRDKKGKEVQLSAAYQKSEGTGYRNWKYNDRKPTGYASKGSKGNRYGDQKRSSKNFGTCKHCGFRNANHPESKCFENPDNKKKPNRFKKYAKSETGGTSVDIQMNRIDVPAPPKSKEECGEANSGFTKEQRSALDDILREYGIGKMHSEAEGLNNLQEVYDALEYYKNVKAHHMEKEVWTRNNIGKFRREVQVGDRMMVITEPRKVGVTALVYEYRGMDPTTRYNDVYLHDDDEDGFLQHIHCVIESIGVDEFLKQSDEAYFIAYKLLSESTPLYTWVWMMNICMDSNPELKERMKIDDMTAEEWVRWYEQQQQLNRDVESEEGDDDDMGEMSLMQRETDEESSVESRDTVTMPGLVARSESTTSSDSSSSNMSMSVASDNGELPWYGFSSGHYYEESSAPSDVEVPNEITCEFTRTADESGRTIFSIYSWTDAGFRYRDEHDYYPNASLYTPEEMWDLESLYLSAKSIEPMTDSQRQEEEQRAQEAMHDQAVVGIALGTEIAVPNIDGIDGIHDPMDGEMAQQDGMDSSEDENWDFCTAR